MPSKRKKNKRRMRRVQAQRRLLEEQYAVAAKGTPGVGAVMAPNMAQRPKAVSIATPTSKPPSVAPNIPMCPEATPVLIPVMKPLKAPIKRAPPVEISVVAPVKVPAQASVKLPAPVEAPATAKATAEAPVEALATPPAPVETFLETPITVLGIVEATVKPPVIPVPPLPQVEVPVQAPTAEVPVEEVVVETREASLAPRPEEEAAKPRVDILIPDTEAEIQVEKALCSVAITEEVTQRHTVSEAQPGVHIEAGVFGTVTQSMIDIQAEAEARDETKEKRLAESIDTESVFEAKLLVTAVPEVEEAVLPTEAEHEAETGVKTTEAVPAFETQVQSTEAAPDIEAKVKPTEAVPEVKAEIKHAEVVIEVEAEVKPKEDVPNIETEFKSTEVLPEVEAEIQNTPTEDETIKAKKKQLPGEVLMPPVDWAPDTFTEDSVVTHTTPAFEMAPKMADIDEERAEDIMEIQTDMKGKDAMGRTAADETHPGAESPPPTDSALLSSELQCHTEFAAPVRVHLSAKF